MLSQVPAGGTQVVDVAGAGLHAAGVVHETGQLPGRQCRGLVSQQLCNILLWTKGAGHCWFRLSLRKSPKQLGTDSGSRG